MNKYVLILLVIGQSALAVSLDDFETSQGLQFDVPDNNSGAISQQFVGSGSDFAIYRLFYVEGGINGNANTITSIEVAGGALDVRIGHDANVENQLIALDWSDDSLTTFWFEAVDLSAFDRMEFDVALLSSPVVITMYLRDKNNTTLQIIEQTVTNIGTRQFNFNDFDEIDFSRIDRVGWEFTRPANSQSAVRVIMQEVRLMGDDLIFSDGFE